MRWLLAPIALFAALILTGCGGSSGSSGSPAATSSPAGNGSSADTIVIKNFMFHPGTLKVAPGATVTIRNEDSVTHTLTEKADPHLFSTGGIPAGQAKTIKAPAKAGSYPFICMIHQYMTGTLVVS